MNVTTTVVTFS